MNSYHEYKITLNPWPGINYGFERKTYYFVMSILSYVNFAKGCMNALNLKLHGSKH